MRGRCGSSFQPIAQDSRWIRGLSRTSFFGYAAHTRSFNATRTYVFRNQKREHRSRHPVPKLGPPDDPEIWKTPPDAEWMLHCLALQATQRYESYQERQVTKSLASYNGQQVNLKAQHQVLCQSRISSATTNAGLLASLSQVLSPSATFKAVRQWRGGGFPKQFPTAKWRFAPPWPRPHPQHPRPPGWLRHCAQPSSSPSPSPSSPTQAGSFVPKPP